MSSLDIAELVGSRPDNVKRTIERLAAANAISLPPLEEVKIQRERRAEFVQVYTFSGYQGRLDSITVVAQLDPLFTAALVKRWDDLETGKAKPALTAQVGAAAVPRSAETFVALFSVAQLIGCDTNAASISANQGTLAVTGLNLLALMGLNSLPSPEQAVFYTPTELGKQCDPVKSAVKVNQALEAAGLQHKPSRHWEPTEAGKAHSRVFDTGKRHNSGTPVQQVKWSPKVLALAGIQP